MDELQLQILQQMLLILGHRKFVVIYSPDGEGIKCIGGESEAEAAQIVLGLAEAMKEELFSEGDAG